ncbi:hypothetical protein TNCV_1973611 [Trichonephila clavipes]|nr:hypothetical protein TNCV_1973611 [Trichonephila clavipes]
MFGHFTALTCPFMVISSVADNVQSNSEFEFPVRLENVVEQFEEYEIQLDLRNSHGIEQKLGKFCWNTFWEAEVKLARFLMQIGFCHLPLSPRWPSSPEDPPCRGDQCMSNMSRIKRLPVFCGVEVRKGGASSGVVFV